MRCGRSAVCAAVVAAAAAGYGFGLATAPEPAVAQGADVIDLDVYARLDALEVRMTGAEDELARPRNVIQAPLRVVAEGGRDLVTVTTDGGLPVVTIGQGIVLGYAESEPRISIFDGDRVAGIHMLDRVPTLYASMDGVDGFYAGPSDRHGNSVRIFEGGQAVATFGVPPGKGAAARFLTGDTLIAGIGIGTSGDGALYTGFADGSPAATAGGNGGGYAEVTVHQGGLARASMNTSDLGGTGLVVVRNSGGTAVSYISEGAGGGGSVTATDGSGNEAFGAGWDGTQGAACVRRQNGNQFCLEPVMPLTRVQ